MSSQRFSAGCARRCEHAVFLLLSGMTFIDNTFALEYALLPNFALSGFGASSTVDGRIGAPTWSLGKEQGSFHFHHHHLLLLLLLLNLKAYYH